MKKKPFTIETKTALLPEIIADTVASTVIVEKFEEKLGKGKIKKEHDAEISAEVKLWTDYLIKRAETHFQKSDTFRKKVMGKENKGRDYLYMFMYHWMGVQDHRVFSEQITTANAKTKYKEAENSMNQWLKDHK